MIDLHHWRATAGAKAFDCGMPRDGTVLRGLPVTNAELTFQVRHHLVGTTQHAGGVDADHDIMASFGPGEEHGIEGCGGLDQRWRQAQVLSDLMHGLVSDIALFVLCRPECGDDGRLAGWISRGQVFDLLRSRLRQRH